MRGKKMPQGQRLGNHSQLPPTQSGALTGLLSRKWPSCLIGKKALSPALLQGNLLQSIPSIAELFPWQQRKGLSAFLRRLNLFDQKGAVGSGSQSTLHPLPLFGCMTSFAVLEF